jgi:hypothetical protein
VTQMEGQHGYEFDDYNVNVLATFAATEAKAAADSLVFFQHLGGCFACMFFSYDCTCFVSCAYAVGCVPSLRP